MKTLGQSRVRFRREGDAEIVLTVNAGGIDDGPAGETAGNTYQCQEARDGAVIVIWDKDPPKTTAALGFPSVPMAMGWFGACICAGFNFGPSLPITRA